MKVYKGLINEVVKTSGKVTATEIREAEVIKVNDLIKYLLDYAKREESDTVIIGSLLHELENERRD